MVFIGGLNQRFLEPCECVDLCNLGEIPLFYNPVEPDRQPQLRTIQGPDVHTAYKESRQRALERLLDRLSETELVGRHYAERYLRDQYRRVCRPNTMRSSCGAIELFLSFITAAGKSHLEEVTREDLYGFIEREQDRGLKPLTVHTRLRAVKAFLRFLIDEDIVDHRVVSRRIAIKVPEALPRAMDPDDVRRLVRLIKDVRNRAMILVLLRTGMRIGELLDTRIRDVSFKECRIEIYEAQKNRGGDPIFSPSKKGAGFV